MVALAGIEGGNLMMDRFTAWATMVVGRLESDEGQTFVEYALILAAVIVVTMLAIVMTGLGTAIQDAVTSVSDAFAP
jgi:Flp pilus assembly pilin Flp